MSVNKNEAVKKIKEEVQTSSKQLRSVLAQIQENNQDGEQMDYCTHPAITAEIDILLSTVKKIEKIWYQE